MNRIARNAISIVACCSLAACATPALWDATNPHRCVAIKKTVENEKALTAKGIAYSVDPEREYIYVEKTALQRAGDYAIRALATPFTVIVDAAGTTIVVVAVLGAATLASAAEQARDSGTPVVIYSN